MFYLDKEELVFGEGVEKLKQLVFRLLKLVPSSDMSYFKIQNIFFNPKFKQKKVPFYYVEEVINYLKDLEKSTSIEEVKTQLKELSSVEEKIKEEAKKNTEPFFLVDFENKKEDKIKISLSMPLEDSLKIEIFNKIIQIKNLKRNASGKFEVYKHFFKEPSQENSYYVDEDMADEIATLIANRTKLKKIVKGSKRILPQPASPKVSETPKKADTLGVAKEARLKFYDPSNGKDNRVVIQLIEPLSNQDRQFILELVKYNFPGYLWEPTKRMYSIRGDFKQYSKMGILLKKFGYKKEIEEENRNGLKWILRNKITNGGVEKTEYDGQIPENFKQTIAFPKSEIEFFEQQKNGVAFLYGRRAALLGDETGYGKTLQMIAAAELKMKSMGQSDAKTLIITLKALVPQWVEEIKKLLGEDEQDKISTMPLKPNKWTVLHYAQFSSGSLLGMILDKIKNTKFSIVVFDELHKLKHEETLRSQNITDVTKDIPYKWGGSATISSNKPLDVRYQLQMIGHPLGQMHIDRFKQDFTGMIKSGRGWKKGTLEEEIRAAERLNKWLNLTGVYIRRSKDELRKMPDIDIDVYKAGISEEDFIKNLRTKLKTYSNPNLRISELIASRQILANMKVPATVKKTIRIVKENLSNSENNYAASKVLVFTNFIEAGRSLEKEIQEELKKINPDFKVITYLGGDGPKEQKEAKEKFTNDPNARVLVMSMKMGGTGMSFPNAARTMIVNDFDWTPESAEQSEGRIYRVNTNHGVKILYTLVDGLDTDLYESVMRKRKIAEIIQKYRKEYEKSELDEDALKKIVSHRKKAEQIDHEIKTMIEKANSRALEENTFHKYLSIKENLKSI